MMICPYCGKENVDRAPFCADCGKSLAGVYDSVAKDESTSDTNTKAVADSATLNEASVESVEAVSVDNGVNIPVHAQSDATEKNAPEVIAEAVTEPANVTAEPVTAQASSTQADPASGATPASNPAPTAQAASATQTVPPAQAASTAQVGAQYQQVPQPNSYAAQTRPVYAKGCVGAAWSDITSSQGWFKKILLLGLIMCVPILNFYVIGYCMRWARQLVLGKIESMPQRIFEEGNFSQGFYGFVWLFVLSLVCGIASSIISWVPLLGAIAAICILIFQKLFGMVGIMRVAISKQLGSGFDISEDWRALTKNFGSLFCAAILPQLIMVGVVFVVVVIMAFMLVALAGASAFQYAPYSYGGIYDVGFAFAMISMLLAMIPAFLICYVVICMVGALVSVWAYRAVGHYVARELPEWKAIAPQFGQ